MTEFSAKPLKYKEIHGLTERQLKEHHDVLYAGYIKKINEIREKLKNTDLSTANATFSDLRELKIEETFAANGVFLHEGYFDNLGSTEMKGKIMEFIEQDFSSFGQWENEFRALGMCSRGWVVLAFDFNDGKLHNYIGDLHNHGGVWGAIPLLIMDVYEHAYFIDYGAMRAKYIDVFMKNINWEFVNSLINRFDIEKFREKCKR